MSSINIYNNEDTILTHNIGPLWFYIESFSNFWYYQLSHILIFPVNFLKEYLLSYSMSYVNVCAIIFQWTYILSRLSLPERRYFGHFERASKSARYAGLLSFRVRKVIVHILKWMRDLTGSQCNRLRIGVERLKRGALVTTLARRFWTRCNLAIFFSSICKKVRYNNLTCYWPVPLQFAWQDLRTDFFQIRRKSRIWLKHALHVWDICFRKFKLLQYVEYYTNIFGWCRWICVLT